MQWNIGSGQHTRFSVTTLALHTAEHQNCVMCKSTIEMIYTQPYAEGDLTTNAPQLMGCCNRVMCTKCVYKALLTIKANTLMNGHKTDELADVSCPFCKNSIRVNRLGGG